MEEKELVKKPIKKVIKKKVVKVVKEKEEKFEPVNVGYISFYGENYSYTEPKIKPAGSVKLDCCFARFFREIPSVQKGKPIYLEMFAIKELEDNFDKFKKLWSNYNLTIEPHFYLKSSSKEKDRWGEVKLGYSTSLKKDAEIGLYTISIQCDDIISDLAYLFNVVCIFMFFRYYSPGEGFVNWREFIYDNKLDFIERALKINNTTGGHTLTNQQNPINIKDLERLNNIEFFNKIMPTKDFDIKGTKDGDLSINNNEANHPYSGSYQYTYTTSYMNYIREQDK